MGHPYNLYHEPLTPFVASFVGQGYFIRGQLLSPDTVQTELGVIRGNRAYSLPSGSAVDVLLRPDDLVHAPQGELKARIVGKTPRRRHPVPPAITHRYPAGIDLPQPCRPPAGR